MASKEAGEAIIAQFNGNQVNRRNLNVNVAFSSKSNDDKVHSVTAQACCAPRDVTLRLRAE
jgi:hypothetical protein